MKINVYKSILFHLLVFSLIQAPFTFISSFFNQNQVYAYNEQINEHAKIKDQNKMTPTEHFVDIAENKKPTYVLPPSEIKRLDRLKERNQKIIDENTVLMEKFYKALEQLGIDAMNESTNSLAQLTQKLVGETKALDNHTDGPLTDAIEAFNAATNVQLSIPTGGPIGSDIWKAFAPPADEKTVENNLLQDKVYNTAKSVPGSITKMSQLTNSAAASAMQLAIEVKNEAMELLKTSVNDSFRPDEKSKSRQFTAAMNNNTKVLAISSASCLDLDCSNLGDTFSVSYHLFKAASAIYLSTQIRLINAYNQNQKEILDSRPSEEGKYDSQTEQIMIATNTRTESISFSEKLKEVEEVLTLMWARVLQVATMEIEQKEVRVEAAAAQGAAAGAAKKAATKKSDYQDDSKDFTDWFGALATGGLFCCLPNSKCRKWCTKILMALLTFDGAIVTIMLLLAMTDEEDDKANELVDAATGGDGGGGSGGSPATAAEEHTKLSCNAAGENMFVTRFEDNTKDNNERELNNLIKMAKLKHRVQKIAKSSKSKMRRKMATKILWALNQNFSPIKLLTFLRSLTPISSLKADNRKKISSALGIVDNTQIYSLFLSHKISEANDMSNSFGEPETRVDYLSKLSGIMGSTKTDNSNILRPNLNDYSSNTSNLSDRMQIFGERKEVGSKDNTAASEEKIGNGNQSSTATKLQSTMSMNSSGGIRAFKGKSDSSMAESKGTKTKSANGTGYLKKMARKLNALGDKWNKNRDAHRRKLGLAPIKDRPIDLDKMKKLIDEQSLLALQNAIKMGGNNEGLKNLMSKLRGGGIHEEDGDEKKNGKGSNSDYSLKAIDKYALSGSGGDSFNSGSDSSRESLYDKDRNLLNSQKEASSDSKDKNLLNMDAYDEEKKNDKYKSNDQDSLWDRITKTYKRYAYPRMLKQKSLEY